MSGSSIAVAPAPLALFAVLLARPSLDASWENHPAHFWLVLGAAAVATALGWSVHVAARRRRDARLVLISLAFIASTGFLGLHALATPGVLLDGPNAGFELATPIGLLVAGTFAAASAIELHPGRARTVVRSANGALVLLTVVMATWAIVSLAELPPLDGPLGAEQLQGWQVVLAAVGICLYGLAAFGFLRLYARRRERFVFAFALAFVLLAQAMVVIAWATNWQLSWWEWHVLMLGAFVVIAAAARSEWHEERFSALYLDETLAGQKEGDELMVVFGGDDDPDHAARAARAALLLQRAAERVARGHDDWPRFRVGVSSGEVHAGIVGAALGHRKHGFVGDLVNTTARLQSEAPVGGVLIGEETLASLGARAVVEPVSPRRVKGKAEPVRAYVLHRVERAGS